MTRNMKDATFDYAMLMSDGVLCAASAPAEVGAAAKIINLGAAVRIDGRVMVDITVMDVGDNDELDDIVVQGSSSSTFGAAIQNLGQLSVGSAGGHTTRGDGAALDVVGHYEIAFTNEQNGTSYRYLRLYNIITGTNTGITYVAHCALKA